MRVEELYLEGEAALKNHRYIEAKHNFELALMEDPEYAPAHNSLGWIYKSQFDDYATAENHFRACIQFSPAYPYPYWHLIDILIDTGRTNEAWRLNQSTLDIPSTSKSQMNYNFGKMMELKGRFAEAQGYYQKAIFASINTDIIESYKKDMERCQYKMEMLNNKPSNDAQSNHKPVKQLQNKPVQKSKSKERH